MWWIPLGMAAGYVINRLMEDNAQDTQQRPRQNTQQRPRQTTYDDQRHQTHNDHYQQRQQRFKNRKENVRNWLYANELSSHNLNLKLNNASSEYELEQIISEAVSTKREALEKNVIADEIVKIKSVMKLCEDFKKTIS
jgi:hypothetical protein